MAFLNNLYIFNTILKHNLLKNKSISKDIDVTVNKEIKSNETIEISGEIIVDTKGLTKSDIEQLIPFITDVKVSTEETVKLKL